MALIGLISDVHATPEPVAEAFAIFASAGVEQIFCAGDIAGYREQLSATVKLLIDNHCQTVVGNHDLSCLAQTEYTLDKTSRHYLQNLATFYETTVAGKTVYMVHAQPPDGCHGGIKLLDRKGELLADRVAIWQEKLQFFHYDVLIVGHTHQVFAEVIGSTLVVNPGSSAFNHSCAILSLPEMKVEMFALQGKKIEKSWNWGEHIINAQ